MMATRPTIIAGNWKMHKTIAEALQFINEFVPLVAGAHCDVLLAAPFTCLAAVAEELTDLNLIRACAQNVSEHEDGAWTGEVSARMIKEAGADYVIVGHSERRGHFHETNTVVNRKAKLALLAELRPIICFGETLAEREAGREFDVVERQLRESLAGIQADDAATVVLAYEPVWAIGTGKNATPEEAQTVHKYARAVLEKIWGPEAAGRAPILYGGSVKPGNAATILAKEDVDGLLVGGASLNAHSFSQIVNANVNHQVV